MVRRILASFLVGATLPLLTACGSAAAATPHVPELAVLGSSNTLTVAGSEGQDTATGYFTLLNPGQQPAHISVTFQAASSDKLEIETVTPTTVASSEAQRVGVTFSGLQDLDGAATGQLVVLGGASPVAQSVEVDPAPQPSAPWPELLIIGSFFLALILALAVVGAMPENDRSSLRNPAPGPKWSFSSWATTLTSAGAVFGTVLGSATLPPFPEQIDKPTLVNLNILFGILVVLGPFLFQALRRRKVSETELEGGRTGTNLTLLMACAITLWAVLGQLGAFSLLAWELVGGGAVGWVLVGALILVGVIAVRYFVLTTSGLVVKSWPIAATAPPAAAAPRRPVDVSRVDRLYLRTALPMMTVRENVEERSAEIAVHPPIEAAPSHWSLL